MEPISSRPRARPAMVLALACALVSCRDSSGPAAGVGANRGSAGGDGVVVNDIHSKLNETRVARIVTPESVEEVQAAVRQARAEGHAVSIAGGRHAMGGQQFASGSLLIDTSELDDVVGFDRERGIVEVEAGIRWPALMSYLEEAQQGSPSPWAIRQKQTGADRLSIGGALAANAHGRGLRFKPMIEDVESFTLVGPDGELRRCSRSQEPELFSLAIGGYGLFGVITTVELRLTRRRKVERVVEIIDLEQLVPSIEQRIADGFLYGDFQFDVDPTSDRFLRRGVFSSYRPVPDDTPIPEGQRRLAAEDWMSLIYLAHADKARAFDEYTSYYASTDGQVYWSDLHQLSEYSDDYHATLDARLGGEPGTEMITEVYVPRDALTRFMERVGEDLRARDANVVYGTIRFIEPDDESFLPWARERYASIIFNLHTAHGPEALEKTAEDFRLLIDRALELGGSYYLTYHRWARRDQVEAAYPQFAEFLRRKLGYDPEERFQSEWYRHYREMFAEVF